MVATQWEPRKNPAIRREGSFTSIADEVLLESRIPPLWLVWIFWMEIYIAPTLKPLKTSPFLLRLWYGFLCFPGRYKLKGAFQSGLLFFLGMKEPLQKWERDSSWSPNTLAFTVCMPVYKPPHTTWKKQLNCELCVCFDFRNCTAFQDSVMRCSVIHQGQLKKRYLHSPMWNWANCAVENNKKVYKTRSFSPISCWKLRNTVIQKLWVFFPRFPCNFIEVGAHGACSNFEVHSLDLLGSSHLVSS